MGQAVSNFTTSTNSGGIAGIAPATYLLPPPKTDDTTLPQTLIHDTGPVCKVPDHWERDYFLVDDIPVYYYVARAQEERGVLVGCSGLKSDRPLDAATVETYNETGISVIIMALPNPGRSLGFMPYFRKVFEQFALDENSPAHTLFHKDLPKFLYGHSTGGQILTHFLTSKQHQDAVKKRYVSAIAEVPFFDTANASLNHSSWIARTMFNAYACLNRDALPKETLFGLFYMHYNDQKSILHAKLPDTSQIQKLSLTSTYILHTAVKTIKDLYFPAEKQGRIPWFQRESEFRTPTYGQILEDQYTGRRYVKRINREETKSSIPLSIIASEKDPFSCPKTSEIEVSQRLNSKFYLAGGEHNPLSEDKKSLKFSIKRMTPYLLEKPPEKEIASIDSEITQENQTPPRWSIQTLGRRFGRAFQDPTRFINSLTSPFKRFL